MYQKKLLSQITHPHPGVGTNDTWADQPLYKLVPVLKYKTNLFVSEVKVWSEEISEPQYLQQNDSF